LARQAAAAHIDLDRIRRAQYGLILQELATTGANHVPRPDELSRIGRHVPWYLRPLLQTPDAAERYAMTITNLARQLTVFERYERRAWTKRNQAFDRLCECLTQRSA
jgi:hypothetical protein